MKIETRELLEAEPLEAVMRRAAAIRDERWGRVITYSRKVFIPLTNLCRDTCGYCVFAKTPSDGARYLSPEEVLGIAEKGRELGCKEALFSLGERPELRYDEAREALSHFGYASTFEYLAAMCELVLRETGLIPHANPGAMSEDEMRLLMPVTGSMGMMLESASVRLTESGMPHHQCPDKHPSVRLRTLESAGRLRIPFTTGLLIGIGETKEDRIETLFAIEEIHERWGGIQEVIIQNFRAKPGTAMAKASEPPLEEMLETIALARLILSPEVGIQAPPNLMPDEYRRYIAAGLSDWGGISPVTLDHINPERAWPRIAELAAATESMGFRLKERLTVYPGYIARAESWIAPRVRPIVGAHAGSDGLPAEQYAL